ncbi:cytochrome P450 [Podospora didyma]|uniref:Cytochrome P450 n=1 Tax=Podospora didyma TaxID=330526 RepID=A0AAE0P7K4_9PEZI|nr:cytochrome P450 [Podospora didyma]
MGLPYRAISATSLAAGYLISSGRILSWPQMGFLATFATAWTVQFSIWFIYTVFIYPSFFSPLRHLPGPDGNHWLLGQQGEIFRQPSGAPMLKWINSIPNDGLIRYKGLLNRERLLITSSKGLAEVLVTKNYDFEKPQNVRQSIGRILGVGVLLAEGDEHKVQRKNLMPAFAFRHVKDLYATFWRKGRECVQAMTKQILLDAVPEDKNTAVIEVGNWASRATLDIIGVAGLGRDFRAIENPNNELNQTYQNLFKPSRQAQILALLGQAIPPWFLNMLPIKRNDDVNSAARYIRATCRALIQEKKQKMANKERVDFDILSVALESGGFTDENLVDQLMTFLAAGHETTASSMTWAIYLLSKHQDVQTRLRAEIRERLPPIDGSIAGDSSTVSSIDVDRMPYLNAVCAEIIRYFAPVPLTLRLAAHDTSIQGQFVPKGTTIILSPWAVNKSEALWGPDASEFKPDRWIPRFDGDKSAAGGGAMSNFAYMTFLHGPRSCIGQAFAKAEFACLLASWIGRFSFELNNKEELDEANVKIKGGITSRPANGLYVRATLVEG